MPVKIEKATLSDLRALQSLEKEAFGDESYTREQLAYLLGNPNAISLKAVADYEIVGFIIGMTETNGRVPMGHIFTVEVAVKHRRTGVGLRLLEELECAFLKCGVKTVYLEVRAENKAAVELYRKMGYTEAQRLENYYPKGSLGLRMQKELRGEGGLLAKVPHELAQGNYDWDADHE